MKLKLLTLFLSTAYYLLSTNFVYAQGVNLQSTYAFGNINSLGQGLNYLVPYVFAIGGTAVVIYFIVGVIKFIFSGGDKNAIADGQQMIIHAIIGFVLLILIFLVILFIPELFGLPRFRIIT